MKCVVKIMIRPFFLRRMASQIARRLKGSTPEVGSSRNTTLLSPRSAIAIDSRLFCPPDIVPARWPFLPSTSSCTSAIASATAASSFSGGTPLTRPYRRRCSGTVSSANKTSCCGQMPRKDRIAGMSVLTSRPQIFAAPAEIGSMPVSMLMVVVLPAPLWPSRTNTCPSYISRSRDWTAVKGGVRLHFFLPAE
mmetsp:Transcript_17546/g.34250  ORF Transcript_17546/g.34250 Transcript_17546/m.34250 type:complete len:193 (+) Transcript_17546:3690-4268(+)